MICKLLPIVAATSAFADNSIGTRFIFTPNGVCNFYTNNCLSLGSPATVQHIRKFLPGATVRYSVECDGHCFLVSAGEEHDYLFAVYSDYKNEKIGSIRSGHKDVEDFLGNKVGDNLSKVLGSSPRCDFGESAICWDGMENTGISYIPSEGIEGDVDSDKIKVGDEAVIEAIVTGTINSEVAGDGDESEKSESAASNTAAASPDFLALPNEVQAYVSEVRGSCTEVYAQADYDVNPTPQDDMQGVLSVELEGRPAIIADNETLCTDHIPAGNCSNRGCDLVIWRQDEKENWHKVFHDHLRGRELHVDASNRFRSMVFGLYAGDARCLPEWNREYYSGNSCSLAASFINGRWEYQPFTEHSARAIEGGDLKIKKGVSLSNRTSKSDTYTPHFDHFPATSNYSGRTKMPDFNRRDRAHRDYRTRIRQALVEQVKSNFAGRFNLVHIGVTGGLLLAVIDSETGRVKWLDTLGDGPYYDFAFKPNSRLITVQWSNGANCQIDSFEWTGSQMRPAAKSIGAPTDEEGFCKNKLHGGRYENDDHDETPKQLSSGLASFVYYKSRAIEGGDLQIIKGLSEGDCRLRCAEDTRCKGFSYDTWNSYCYPKAALSPLRRDPRYFTELRSGIHVRDSKHPHSISKRQNKGFGTQPYRSDRATSFDACGRRCIADDQCDAISFDRVKRICHRLSEPAEFFDQSGLDIGVRLQSR